MTVHTRRGRGQAGSRVVAASRSWLSFHVCPLGRDEGGAGIGFLSNDPITFLGFPRLVPSLFCGHHLAPPAVSLASPFQWQSGLLPPRCVVFLRPRLAVGADPGRLHRCFPACKMRAFPPGEWDTVPWFRLSSLSSLLFVPVYADITISVSIICISIISFFSH